MERNRFSQKVLEPLIKIHLLGMIRVAKVDDKGIIISYSNDQMPKLLPLKVRQYKEDKSVE